MLSPADRPHLYVILGLVVGLVAFAHVLTPLLRIELWAVHDVGGHLVLPDLIERNLTPNIDFVYTYGPATIALNCAWARLFGNSWQSFFALFAILHLTLAISLALLPYALRMSRIGSIACILTLLLFLRFEYSIAHQTEKIFLVNAAIFIAYRRYGVALALCTVSVLFRPSSGLVAGALILAWFAWSVREQEFHGAVKSITAILAPSTVVLVGTACIYISWLGAKSFFWTVLPLSGSKLYQPPSIAKPLQDLLPRFLPEGQNIIGYMGANPSHVLLFAIGGLCLFCVAYAASDKTDNRTSAVALLTFTLVVVFFTSFSRGVFYNYYTPTLWVGLVALVALPRVFPALQWPCAIVVGVIAASLITSTIYKSPSIARELTTLVKHDFRRLTVSEELKADVESIRRWVPTGAVSVMPIMGQVALLQEIGLSSPQLPSWCFRNQGFNLKPELQAARKQVQRNPWIVVRVNQADYFPFRQRVARVYEGRHLSLLVAK